MARKKQPEDLEIDNICIGLKFPVPEREVLLNSKFVAENQLRERVNQATPRQVISFTIEELEDLHRGLAFEANQTAERKRAKTIGKVLQRIEEALDEVDEGQELTGDEEALSELADIFGDLGERAADTPPTSPADMLDLLFNSIGTGPDDKSPAIHVSLSLDARRTLRSMETIALDVHKMVASDSPDAIELRLNLRQMLTTLLALREAIALAADETAAKPFMDIAECLAESMAEESNYENVEIDDAQRYRESQQSPARIAYRLKITLDHSEPAICRTVLVADCTLDVLHQIIQIAMGWENAHLHQFQHGKDRFSDPRFDLDAGPNDYDETSVRISDLAAQGCKKFRYGYDFGDDWWHTIKIEKKLTPKPTDTFPICVDGAGACPPEDCGGIWGYYDLLQAIKDPNHERHEEIIDWIGGEFDPDRFDIEETNKCFAAGHVPDDDAPNMTLEP